VVGAVLSQDWEQCVSGDSNRQCRCVCRHFESSVGSRVHYDHSMSRRFSYQRLLSAQNQAVLHRRLDFGLLEANSCIGNQWLGPEADT
jgi:hypothetical protein